MSLDDDFVTNVTMDVIDDELAKKLIYFYFNKKDYEWPDLQDAATFCALEAMEMIDAILRKKNYNRNHEKDEKLEKEMAQTFLMLKVTALIAGVDLNDVFNRLINGEYD